MLCILFRPFFVLFFHLLFFQIPPQRTQIYIYTKCYKQLVEWNFQQLLTEKTEVKASLSHDADSILKADPTILRIQSSTHECKKTIPPRKLSRVEFRADFTFLNISSFFSYEGYLILQSILLFILCWFVFFIFCFFFVIV